MADDIRNALTVDEDCPPVVERAEIVRAGAQRSGARGHQQYEKFYGGASFVVKQNVYRTYDFKRATAMVDAALALPPVKDE